MTGRIATVIDDGLTYGAVAAQQPQRFTPDVPLADVTFTLARTGRMMPVSDLEPGDYVLELEARSLIEPMRVVKRELGRRVRE